MYPLLREDHCLVSVEDDSILDVITHSPGQNPPFDVAPLPDQVIRRIAMADALDVLFDDGAFIEVRRDVVRRCSNELHATLMRLMVRPCALEPGQERMVNIDATASEL